MFQRRRIEFAILNLLKQKGGSVTDRELFEFLRRVFDISYPEFIYILMCLELEGFISVRAASSREGRIIVLRRST